MAAALFLAHRIPYPPQKGDKIRSHHWLRYLATRFDVHLGTFVDHEEDFAHVHALDRWCKSKCVLPLDAIRAKLRSLIALPTGHALSEVYYRDPKMQRYVDSVLAEHEIDVIVVFSSTMAQYVEGDKGRGVRKVVDFVDVDSDKWRQYGETRRWPMSYIYRREALRLGAAERRIARDFDASLFATPAEVSLFTTLAPDVRDKAHCIANGVDTSYFDPGSTYPDPYPRGSTPIVFTGAMDYWPNVDAVTFFAREVLPEVRRQRPDVLFYVVGAHPNRAVKELHDQPGVHVTGAVRSVRPYLAHARLAVAPIRVARGIQNKVLEALAMRLPVVLTPSAHIGIGHDAEESGMTVVAAEELATATLAQLDRAEREPQPGRAFVLRHFQWEPAFREFGRILDAS